MSMATGTYTAPKRKYRLEWVDSCRRVQTFATYFAADLAATRAKPCQGVPCKWRITLAGLVLKEGAA